MLVWRRRKQQSLDHRNICCLQTATHCGPIDLGILPAQWLPAYIIGYSKQAAHEISTLQLIENRRRLLRVA
ncbi:hypothetical protein LMH87_010619 [Akanthomyces muscarius]|uniref:Uncharacterized protein n=1 Tax=Akanthomyces muscarius TaxID=2231603 RepID=A0A9W8QDN2_AKAMU|nr:hypothetical protein LMH87_010619 [Akanthomyces muscarius]KAJ4154158.1 hypothetical protein LMH87_010619 [Akanthomyces muscarius]